MQRICDENLSQIAEVVSRLSQEQLTCPLEVLSGASIGQHVRHSLEFYQCILNSSGEEICYDDREHDKALEEDKALMFSAIESMRQNLESLERDSRMHLVISLDTRTESSPLRTETSFERELIYAVEHAIHHMAIIKIGIRADFPEIGLPENFGVAYSTTKFKKENVHRHIPAR